MKAANCSKPYTPAVSGTGGAAALPGVAASLACWLCFCLIDVCASRSSSALSLPCLHHKLLAVGVLVLHFG